MSHIEAGLKAGQDAKYTLFYSTDMAMTARRELTIVQFNGNRFIYKMKGKRSLYQLELKPHMLFLRGWDLPLKIDSDFNSFAGNAMINFVGKPEELRTKIEELNEYKLADKSHITYTEDESNPNNNKHMLYAELAQDSTHPVIRRILDNK